jgi:hypothetical protein
VEALADGGVEPAGEAGLEPWVYAVVYSGFGLLALAMGVVLLDHVLRRWAYLVAEPPQWPSWSASLVGALGLLPFALAMAFWGSLGPGGSGPQGMDRPAQRTVMVVTGVLSAAAFVVPFSSRAARRWPEIAWLVAWTGCCVAAVQGPAQLLLAHGGNVEPVVASIALLTTPGACAFGVHLLRRQLGRAGACSLRVTRTGARVAGGGVGRGTSPRVG